MAGLDEVLVGVEDKDPDFDHELDEEEEKARLAKAAQAKEKNDATDLGVKEVEEKIDEEKNEEVAPIKPKHPAGSVHSRLGPRLTEEEIKEGQENAEESQENECSGDEEESRSQGEDDDDDDDEEEEEDEDSRRSRFKSERTRISQNISLTTTKAKRNIPDSLDDIIQGDYYEPRRPQNNKGSVWSRLHRPNAKNVRFRMNGPDDGIGGFQQLQYQNSPGPIPSLFSTFNQDFTADYYFENFGNPHAEVLDKSDLRYSIGTGGDVRSRLGGSVTNNQAGMKPQDGTPSLKRPHADNAIGNTDSAKQMKQGIPFGKNAVSLLHEMYKGKINFVEKQIGNVHVPEFECSVEIEGQTFKGVGKAKKAAKKLAAEAAFLALTQNGVTTVDESQAAKTTTVTPQNGTTTPLGKDITPDGDETTTSLQTPLADDATEGTDSEKQMPHADDAIESTDSEKQMPHADDVTENTDSEMQMMLEIPSGINPISTLNEMYKGQIKFVDKVIGDIHLPNFECSVEIEGQTYKGEGKQKKLAKKKAAEATLLGLMQNWCNGILPIPGPPQQVIKQLIDAQSKLQQQKGIIITSPQQTSDPPQQTSDHQQDDTSIME